MSRIGKVPVVIPAGVKVSVTGSANAGNTVSVEGPLGKLQQSFLPQVSVNYDEGAKKIVVERGGDTREHRAIHGLTRALVRNMVIGVTQGYEKKLEVVGVGYLAALQKDQIQLRVGFANEVHLTIPSNVKVTCPDQTHIVIKGSDKQAVGQFAAEIRSVRKPEPYKGKGIRYEGEQVRRKAGKADSK
ncbi:MAG: 50S ribosomal protein L6 [Planctomycetota bacterium]|nr:50S ribosomal protein L6 [Planctomycetota bacterium]